VTVVLAVVFLASWPSQRRPADTPVAPTGASTPAPTATVACHEEPGDLAAGLTRPACPSAILAVELAVAPVRLPIERIVIEPGPFFCDVIWPGAQSPVVCFNVFVRPGQYMHAWVSFVGSSKVAAVMLGLDLPPGDAPVATRPPWQTTLVAVEVPPSGWVMP
jgi:hypothetical protein